MVSRKYCFMLMIGLILSIFVTDVMGENLIKYYEDQNGTIHYYKKDSINQESGTLKVWCETRFNGKNKEWSNMVEVCKRNYELNSIYDCNNLSYSKNLVEINCKENIFFVPSEVLYDEDGHFIITLTNPSQTRYVIPDTVMEELKNRVCRGTVN